MPVLVNCPSCSGTLRVTDELLGRKVRCPACQTVFEAVAPSSSNGDARFEESERIDTWKHLDLEMNRAPDPAPPRSEEPPASPPPRRGLVGAIELDPGPQEPPRRPNPPSDDPRPPRSDRENGELRPCPGCAKMIHRDSTRCYSCGERTDGSQRVERGRIDYRDEPRDRRRYEEDPRDRDEDYRERFPARRDCEPHRGTTVLVMGILSLVCLMGFCFYGITCIVGVVLGAIGWWMGHADLNKMKAGNMDPEGRGSTQAGWICSILGSVLNLLTLLSCGAFIGFFIYQDMQRNPPPKGGFQPPPPKVQPAPKPKMAPVQKL